MAYRGYTDAQRRATNKYQKENMDQISIRTKKGTRGRWKDAADQEGISLAQLIISSVEGRIKNLPEDSPPTIQL